MKSIFKDIAKSGTLFFVVGVLLAMVAPPLARAIGPEVLGEAAFSHAIATPILWTGAFFGAFGAIDAAVKPAFNWMFGDKEKAGADNGVAVAREKSDATQVNITVQQAPQLSQEQNVVDANFRAQIKDERLAIIANERS